MLFAVFLQFSLPGSCRGTSHRPWDLPAKTQPAAPKPTAQVRPQDGALQILGILQRDSRLIDFLMEDISSYSDDQVGAAVRSLHDQSRDSLNRYLRLRPSSMAWRAASPSSIRAILRR